MMDEVKATKVAVMSMTLTTLPTDEFLAVICTMLDTHYLRHKDINPIRMSKIVAETIEENWKEGK